MGCVGGCLPVAALAGLRGPWASAMFTVVRLTADQTAENLDRRRGTERAEGVGATGD